MPQLQRLACKYCNLRVEGVRAFQPAVQANRTLAELSLWVCRIRDEGIRLIAEALVGNTTMEVLDIGWNGITSVGLDDITRILESTQLKSITLSGNEGVFDSKDATQRFVRGRSRHECLKALSLRQCELRDGGFRIIVDGLVGNTILEVLDISWNGITSVGLADITRLIESTLLQTIKFQYNDDVFDEDATQRFVTTLQDKKSSVQELSEMDEDDFPEGSGAATCASIINTLTHNQQLNRVNLLLALPPQQQQQQQRNDNRTALMQFKTWHKTIMKFAMVPNNAGASAIFKLFQCWKSDRHLRVLDNKKILLHCRIMIMTIRVVVRPPQPLVDKSVDACSFQHELAPMFYKVFVILLENYDSLERRDEIVK